MDTQTARRILVIDDEKSLCEVLKARLETFGYAPAVAYDGAEGWQEVLTSPPDLILLDIKMPGMDGYTFLRKLRFHVDADHPKKQEQIRKIPVIVITGTGEGMKPLFEQEKISAYITKPIDSTVLKKLIEEALARE